MKSDDLSAAERLASITLGAAGKHAERVLELEAEVSTLREHLAEVNRLLSLNVATVGLMRHALIYYRDEYSGYEPSVSVFDRMVDELIRATA